MSRTTADAFGSTPNPEREPESHSSFLPCPPTAGDEAGSPKGTDAARILVVDDEPELRELLVDTFAAPGTDVIAAGSGTEALAAAGRDRPDVVITDLCLGDCNGLDVLDRLHEQGQDIPAVVITGYADPDSLTRASRRRPIELMTKPLDLDRLRRAVRDELSRRDHRERRRRRTRRLRRMARDANRQRKTALGKLETTCADLTCAYRQLSGQMSIQQAIIGYQHAMIAAANDDDVFATLFRLFAVRSGPLFGVAMVCDEQAHLNVIGRFGVPKPDGLGFCRKLARPVIERVLTGPKCFTMDAGDEAELFDPAVRRHLPGVTLLAIPLVPSPGELIGVAVLYRKGEQPFTDADLTLAEMAAFPTATAVRRND